MCEARSPRPSPIFTLLGVRVGIVRTRMQIPAALRRCEAPPRALPSVPVCVVSAAAESRARLPATRQRNTGPEVVSKPPQQHLCPPPRDVRPLVKRHSRGSADFYLTAWPQDVQL